MLGLAALGRRTCSLAAWPVGRSAHGLLAGARPPLGPPLAAWRLKSHDAASRRARRRGRAAAAAVSQQQQRLQQQAYDHVPTTAIGQVSAHVAARLCSAFP